MAASCSAAVVISIVVLPADGPAKHWLNRALNNFKGVKGAVSNGTARNLVWMPIVTCLLYASLKMAEGNPDDILANCQVSHVSFPCVKAVVLHCLLLFVGLHHDWRSWWASLAPVHKRLLAWSLRRCASHSIYAPLQTLSTLLH